MKFLARLFMVTVPLALIGWGAWMLNPSYAPLAVGALLWFELRTWSPKK